MASLKRASLSLFSLLLSSTLAQFISPPTDLTHATGNYDIPVRYKLVPNGTCELTPGVNSYAGYVDISEHEHVFFWFFEARETDPEESDLTIWINGGPGSSSMIGMFQELGPCRIAENGSVVDNPWAWNRKSNMLFIDHPAQVGFSYSDPVPAYESKSGNIIQLPDPVCPDYAPEGSCGTYSAANTSNTPNTTLSAGPSMWRTLQGFTGAFPQYSSRSLNFATESYGGHYGPIFTSYILSQNDLIASNRSELQGAQHLPLKTLLIGNGWYDPLVQYQAYYNFTVFPGNTYDYRPFNKSTEAQMYNSLYGRGNCYDQTVDCNLHGSNSLCMAADSLCATEVESLLDDIPMRDEYDIRELTPDPFPQEYFVDYLNTPKVQSAVGAFVNYSESSSTVSAAFSSTGDDDREVGTVAAMRNLIAKGIYVIMFAGDADYNCNWLGNEVIADTISAPGWRGAGYTNVSTSDHIVHGQVKQSENFAFVRVFQSGHEVPFYQPVIALEMFERGISGTDIEGGKEACSGQRYKTIGTVKSEYREGNGTVQFEVLPGNSTYDEGLNGPDPMGVGNGTSSQGKERRRKRGFKPSFVGR